MKIIIIIATYATIPYDIGVFFFRSRPGILSKLPLIPSQHFYFCYFDCQSSPHPLHFIQLPSWRWTKWLFSTLFDGDCFFDRCLWFHRNIFIVSLWLSIFPTIHHVSFIFLRENGNNRHRNHLSYHHHQVSLKFDNNPSSITSTRIDGQWTHGYNQVSR